MSPAFLCLDPMQARHKNGEASLEMPPAKCSLSTSSFVEQQVRAVGIGLWPLEANECAGGDVIISDCRGIKIEGVP